MRGQKPLRTDGEVLAALRRLGGDRAAAAAELGYSTSALEMRLSRLRRAGQDVPLTPRQQIAARGLATWMRKMKLARREAERVASRPPAAGGEEPLPELAPQDRVDRIAWLRKCRLARRRQAINQKRDDEVLSASFPPAARTMPLGKLLEFAAGPLADHPLIDPEELRERRELERAELHARDGWWNVRVDVLVLSEPRECGRDLYHQVIEIETNQPKLTRGDLERIFALGIRALHKQNGEVPRNVDGVEHRGPRGR